MLIQDESRFYFPLSHLAHVLKKIKNKKALPPEPVNLAEFSSSEQRDSAEITCTLCAFRLFITNAGFLIKSGGI